jgi:hypothetical protein
MNRRTTLATMTLLCLGVAAPGAAVAQTAKRPRRNAEAWP